MPPRRSSASDTASRTALLDGTEQLMLEEGYAAASSRRVAAMAGLDPAVVYYYFGTMDALFIEVFRRNADRSLQRQEEALASAQPLWGLWEASHNQMDTSLLLEFNALSNHRKVIRAEISAYSDRARRRQICTITESLRSRKVDTGEWSPEALAVLLTGMARYMQLEEAFSNEIGHPEADRTIEGIIRRLEGERATPSPLRVEEPSKA